MGSPEDDQQTDSSMTAGPTKVLYLVALNSYYVFASAESIALAHTAQQAADDIAYFDDFGELRSSGNFEMLADRLFAWDSSISLETYVDAIEKSAGRVPASADIAERLKAVSDVEFEDDSSDAPADSCDIRTTEDIENEVEDYFGLTLEQTMYEDVPEEVLAKFSAQGSAMFSEVDQTFIEPEHVEEMVVELEALGYTIIRGTR